MSNVQAVSKLYMDTAGNLTTTWDATYTPYGGRVVWLDSRGTMDYVVTQLPNTLLTAADVQTYMNTIVGTGPAGETTPSQTRIGKFLGCYAKVSVYAFTPDAMIDYDITIGDAPNSLTVP